MTIGTKPPLGARINNRIETILSETSEIRKLAQSLTFDSELPPKSKLTESHWDDLGTAIVHLSQAAELMGNLTQEALDELSE
jgi:hypothetical protein